MIKVGSGRHAATGWPSETWLVDGYRVVTYCEAGTWWLCLGSLCHPAAMTAGNELVQRKNTIRRAA